MKYKQLSDEELLNLAKNNDSDAVECLILRYRYLVSAYAHSYFLVDGDVEDLIQVGQIAVYKAIVSYNGLVEFKYYVSKCVKNAMITAIKKSNANKNLPLNNYLSLSGFIDGDSDKNILLADLVNNPEQAFINLETEKELKEKIKNTLSKLESEILSYYLQGYSYSEIALNMDKNVKSIDNALQRIKNKLLQKLQNVG